VRATAVYALGKFLGGAVGNEQRTSIELNLGLTLPVVTADSSPIVRKELAITLSVLICDYEEQFREVALDIYQEEAKQAALERGKEEERKKMAKKDKKQHSPSEPVSRQEGYVSKQQSSVYGVLWKLMLSLARDPMPEVAALASTITERINAKNSIRYIPIAAAIEPRLIASTPGRFLARTSSIILQRVAGTSSSNSRIEIETPPEVDTNGELVPLASNLYEWSCEHFSKPLLHLKQEDDETSPLYCERLWRHQLRKSLKKEAKNLPNEGKIDHQILCFSIQ
jgi:hypothetical protein